MAGKGLASRFLNEMIGPVALSRVLGEGGFLHERVLECAGNGTRGGAGEKLVFLYDRAESGKCHEEP